MGTNIEFLHSGGALSETSTWDELKGVEFAGDFEGTQRTEPVDNPENAQEKVAKERDAEIGAQRIRELTDWRAKAEREDPQGFAEAVAKDDEDNMQKERRKQEIRDQARRYQELSMMGEEHGREKSELKSLQDEKEKSWFYHFKQKIGIQDRQMMKWKQKLEQIDALSDEKIKLAMRGYGNDESVQKILSGIGEEAHTQEEAFVEKFVSPLEKEQKKELLKFDNLAKLSTREYLDLWKGLNPYYLSHVTRQGYRDHAGMTYHSEGLGEFHDGFKQIMKGDRKLHSTWEIATGKGMSQVGDAEVVGRYFQVADTLPEKLSEGGELDKESLALALGGGHGVLSQPDGYWQDKTSVHFMSNAIGNNQYGAEEGNEVFFIFPADVLASQCYSNTPLASVKNVKDLGKREAPWQSDDHNDYFVMPRENGIPIDAGLVFLPKSVLVDSRSGSKYQGRDGDNLIPINEENGVRAEQYWERYFAEHPEEKPAHVVYYDGAPSEAINSLLENYGIVVGGVGDLGGSKELYDCGFGENIAFGGTEAEKELEKECDTFFEKMAEYIEKQRHMEG